jgi:hypothetical protein
MPVYIADGVTELNELKSEEDLADAREAMTRDAATAGFGVAAALLDCCNRERRSAWCQCHSVTESMASVAEAGAIQICAERARVNEGER